MRDFEELLRVVQGIDPVTVAVVDAAEIHVLQGALDAHERGIIDPILIGDEARIRELARDMGIPPDASLRVVHAENDDVAAEMGVQMVLDGAAAALMKGHLHTDTFLHPILAKLRIGRRLSHVFVADLTSYPRLLCITDAAIAIAPDLHAKIGIVENAVHLAHVMGIDIPRVAIISAVEVVNAAIPSTLDAAALAKMAAHGEIAGALVDGPLALDNAISEESARIKGLGGEVAGRADVLVMPDIVSGNVLAKALEYLAGATLAGIVLGARVPIILTSRADPPRARVVSAALAALLHKK